MEKRLFVIKNGTHYLNAKNYIDGKRKAENYIFLTIRRFEGYKEFRDKIKNDTDFHLLGVMYMDRNIPGLNYFYAIKNIIKVKKLARRINFFDEAIFTNYNSWTQHFVINQFKTDRKVLLSDGTRTLMVVENRKHDKSINLKSVPFGGGAFIIKNILNITPIEKLRFYSPVNLDLAEGDSVEVFNFKRSGSTFIDSNKLYFIGSPLVEIGYLSLEIHLKYLKKIKDDFPSFQIFYFAHRRENQKNLEKYKFFGKIIHNEVPFEEKMEMEETLPAIIMSFLSSVIMNLPSVYPQVQFNYFAFDIKDLISNSKFHEDYTILIKSFRQIKEPNFREYIPT